MILETALRGLFFVVRIHPDLPFLLLHLFSPGTCGLEVVQTLITIPTGISIR